MKSIDRELMCLYIYTLIMMLAGRLLDGFYGLEGLIGVTVIFLMVWIKHRF